MELKIKTVRPSARVPAYATPGSAAMDLCAACGESVAVAPRAARDDPDGHRH